MSLPHVLLGLLQDPATGYDLRQSFETGAAHYWAAELSQIYPALKKLEAAGHLRSEAAPPTKGPSRRVYHRTPAGREELCRWIRSGAVVGTQRLAYVAQIEFAHETGDLESVSTLVADLQRHFEPLRDLLVSIDAEFDAAAETGDLDDRSFHEHLAVRLGVLTLNARLEWCGETLKRIEGRQ